MFRDSGTLFQDVYRGRRILVTGHTGFKGSWLVMWLTQLGAQVVGFSDAIHTHPSHYECVGTPGETHWGDVRDQKTMRRVMDQVQPDMVFHFAAQPLVRKSYEDPVETFDVNVMGTVQVLEACRHSESVQAVVVATSDKVYLNLERPQGYSETDCLGGKDPYSSSKSAVEHVAATYRHLLAPKTLCAVVRAGNVIGGGDWAKDRLLPDLYRGVETGKPVAIRYPYAHRPWQHVLDSLSGYMVVGQHLLQGNHAAAAPWNVGPSQSYEVAYMLKESQRLWPAIQYVEAPTTVPEAGLLMLDTSHIQRELGWQPVYSTPEALGQTWEWYRAFFEYKKVQTLSQIETYVRTAQERCLIWTE